jgi:hypothetical protein
MFCLDTHRCPPGWEIKHPDWLGDELKVVHARDAQAAGEKYARVTDNYGDYEFANGHEAEVQIRKAATATEKSGKWETYILNAEPSVEYHARSKDGE